MRSFAPCKSAIRPIDPIKVVLGGPRPWTDGWVPLHFRFGRRWAGRLLLTLLGFGGALLPPPQIFPLFPGGPPCMHGMARGGIPPSEEYSNS